MINLALLLVAQTVPPVFNTPVPAPVRPINTRGYKTVGKWAIRIDDTLDRGCYFYRMTDARTLFRVGLDPTTGELLIILGNANWQSLVVDKLYPIAFIFDRGKPQEGDGYAFRFKGQDNVNYLRLRGPLSLLSQLRESKELSITTGGRVVDNVPLDDAALAVDATLTCQKDIEANRDPFAGATGKEPPPEAPAKDPFST